MGSSGNLSIISLEKYPFEKIKEHMLKRILDRCPKWSDPNHTYEKLYFMVSDFKDIDDFIFSLNSKVVNFCPEENGISINGIFYDNWARQELPQIIDNHLILYSTDQQMAYQNRIIELLFELISDSAQIWT